MIRTGRRAWLRAGITAALGASLLLGLAGCDSLPRTTPTPRPDFRVGLITDAGSVRDGTFNEYAHRGAERAAAELNLDYTYREPVDSSHYDLLFEELLADDRQILVTVGFLMTEATLVYARQHPDVYFIGVDQSYTDPPPNVLGLQFREDEGGFLAGALAGMMTASGHVGVVAGMEIPPVVRFVNGYQNGVQYVNPQADVRFVFADSFINADFGRETARQWLDDGVDVLFGAGGLTGSTAIFEAAGLGAWVIGVDQDEWRTTFASGTLAWADRVLTSAVKRVDVGVYRAIRLVVDGRFEGGSMLLSAADCGVGYAPFHDTQAAIPAEVAARLEAIWRALAGGTLHTGASGEPDDLPPAPLGEAEPPVSADAPTLAQCEQ